MTEETLPVESVAHRFGAPDVPFELAAEIGKPQPWPGLPIYACPYRVGDKAGVASGVDEAAAVRQAAQTVADILARMG